MIGQPQKEEATSGFLDQVRASCQSVAKRARHVHINEDAIAGYAAALPPAAVAAPELDPAHHYLADRESTVAFFFTLDTVNFGSGYWPVLQKRPGLSGYFTIATSLKDAFEEEGPWNAEALSTMTPARCALVFGQDSAFPLMARYAVALNEFGRYLLEAYDGDPIALLESVDGSAEVLAERLASLRCYQDVATYRGEGVAFYKRAQLMSADLDAALSAMAQRHSQDAPPTHHFHDLDRLTIFADNLAPHVLRLDGVLSFTPELVTRIEAEGVDRGRLARRGRDPSLRGPCR